MFFCPSKHSPDKGMVEAVEFPCRVCKPCTSCCHASHGASGVMRDHKRLSGTKAGQPQRQTPKNFHDAAPGPLATRQETDQIAFFLSPSPPPTPFPPLHLSPHSHYTAQQLIRCGNSNWSVKAERDCNETWLRQLDRERVPLSDWTVL